MNSGTVARVTHEPRISSVGLRFLGSARSFEQLPTLPIERYEVRMRMSVLLLLVLPAVGFTAEPPPVSLAELERGCAKGDGPTCVDYAYALEASDAEKAVKVYRAACGKNVLPACSNLALLLRDARGAPKDLDEATAVAKKACVGKNAPGCLHWGLVREAANDFPGANTAYEKACTLSVFPACTNLAINLIKGVGAKADAKRAAALLEKTCTASVKKGTPYPSLRACVTLGQLFDQGALGPADLEAAKKLYRLACFSGLDEACQRLGSGPTNVNEAHGH